MKNKSIDMIISNFVYEKKGEKYKKIMKYKRPPRRRPFSLGLI